jgi:predicted nucleic acid-binding protein
LLLAELERALAYPKLRALVPEREAADFVDLLRRAASFRPDPVGPPARSDDPDDDYLLALAEQERALVVSGDRHLLALGDRFPVISPRAFLAELQASQGSE